MHLLSLAVCVLILTPDKSADACNPGCVNNDCKGSGECRQGCYTGYYGAKCGSICYGCLNNNCYSSNVYCPDGCKPDYYGNYCDKQCPTNCSSCNINTYCEACKHGYHGGTCEFSCPDHCRDDSCDRNNGGCSNGCDMGYTGVKCNSCATGYYIGGSECRGCPITCYSCSSFSNCYSCKQGYYGVNCGSKCSPGCPNNNCYKSDGKCGSTNCNAGYHGDKCDQCMTGWYKNLDKCEQCDIKCSACTSTDCTSCNVGYYGWKCQSTCSKGCKNGQCLKAYGYCSECKDGFTGNYCRQCVNGKYGTNCDNDCPQTCFSCSSATICIVCNTGHYGRACEHSCSEGCDGGCVKQSGTCSPCKVGFSGDKCCVQSSNCEACSSNTECSVCRPGYHGTICNSDCPQKCAGSCNKLSGVCANCNPGYFGPTCEETCSKNCNDCNQNGTCGSCKNGFYGSHCTNACPRNCNTCKDGYTCVSCKSGYYGPVCDGVCPNNCVSCYENTWNSIVCNQCKDGYKGSSCSDKCAPKCKACLFEASTYCTSCALGKHTANRFNYLYYKKYLYCDRNCPKYCLHGICSDVTGECSQGCVNGYTGAKCLCPENCNNCNIYSQTCNSGYCEVGYTGDTCSCTKEPCSDLSCSSCSNSTWYASEGYCCKCSGTCKDSECSDASTCTRGCIHGYYGVGCSQRCLDRDNKCLACTDTACTQCESGYYPSSAGTCTECSQHCVNRNCSSFDGTCIDGCSIGFWDTDCTKSCVSDCEECDRDSGICNACKNGKFMRNCTKDCTGRCNTDGVSAICDIDNGSCKLGCTSKTFHGKSCELNCSTSCFNQECNWETGKCSNGCIMDYFGEWCENKCSDNCISRFGSRRCHSSNGTCSYDCLDGHYGHDCQTNCGANCVNATCSRGTGACTHGCIGGFEGSDCAQALEQSGSTNTGVIAGGVAGGLVLILLIVGVLVVCVVVRRRRGEKSTKFDSTPATSGNANSAADEGGPVYSNASATVNLNMQPNKSTNMSNPMYKNHGHISMTNSLSLESDPYTIVIEELGETPVDEEEEEDAPDLPSGDVDIRGDVNDTYYNASAITRVAIDRLEEYVARKPKESLEQEFLSFPKTLIKPYGDSQKPFNVPRNRYRGVYPYDFNRVKLKTGETDYINASYIDGYEKKNEYIAALGPTDKTTEDFVTVWCMIWQEGVEKIVMLTNLMEGGKMKCHQYWPDPGTNQQYGDVTVTCMAEDKTAEFTIRTMSVTMKAEKRVLYHFHYTAWPDRGVPDDVTGLIEFRDKVLGVKSTLDGPVMVHCSAGVGRTGTYIALDYLTNEGEETESVDVFECVSNLRQQRIWMVQTEEQYVYLHDAVVHSLTFDSKPIPSEKFQDYLRCFTPEKLQKNYEHLKFGQDRREPEEKKSVQKNSSYKNKNNPTADIPGDRYRPKLHLDRVHGSCDYINAVYLDSFRARNSYIVAQTPLKSTVEDFLTLIFQDHIPCIVDMQPHPQNKKHVGEYLPADNQEVTHGDYEVKSTKVKSNTQFILRRLAITRNAQNGPEERIFYHYQLVDWNDKSATPPSPPDFINFVREVEVKAREDFEDGKILVHCVSGAERSGLFCAVSVMLQKMESEHEISVVNTVRQIKSRRQRALPNKEQYLFCHQCISAYLDTFDTYSNFAIRQ